MSKALEIAEERFARGEITEEELEKIKTKITTPSAQIETATGKPSSGGGAVGIIFLVFFLILIVIGVIYGFRIGSRY